jgi:hypothetical protein
MYLLAICTSFFENFLFNSCAHFFIRMWLFQDWVFWFPYRFWVLVPYQMIACKDFLLFFRLSLIVWWLFPLLYGSSLVLWVPFVYSFPWCWVFWALFRKLFTLPIWSTVFPTASWSCFSFRPYIQVFGPLWVDFHPRWKIET